MDSAVPVIELLDDDLKSQTIITLDDDKNESKVPIVTLEDDCSVKKTQANNPKSDSEIILDDEETEYQPVDLDSEGEAAEYAYVISDDSDSDVSEIITVEDEQIITTENTNATPSQNSSDAVSDIYLVEDDVDYEVSTNTSQKKKPLSTSNKKSINSKSVSKIEKISDEKQIVSSLNKKPYVCENCKEAFLEKNVFNAHMKTHNTEKPYVCDICFKEFKDKKILRMHYNTHTGEKPFACTICDKVYSNTVALRKHYKIHIGEKPYVCDVCLVSFDQKSNLCDHKLEKHNFLTVV